MEEPLISVVIPVWNEEVRVARAINSIRDQTYKNLEIIVVDDGSTDGSAAVVGAIATQDSRVSYHQNPHVPARVNWRGYDINAGWAARAYGFSIAKGEWITTQDADDASLLNRIETQYNLAKKHNATLVTIQWLPVTEQTLGKKLNVERLFQEKGDDGIIIHPEVLTKVAVDSLGIFMRLPFHHLIPFSIKWLPYTRRLFYATMPDYPGADNSMLFHRKVLEAGINFRERNKRTWGVPSGRGSGRDFVCSVAYTFKNSWSFRLPLYLLSAPHPNPDFVGYEKYLI